MTVKKCPPLGMGSVDFSALHEADRAGKDLSAALAKATVRGEPPAKKPTPAKPKDAAAPEASDT